MWNVYFTKQKENCQVRLLSIVIIFHTKHADVRGMWISDVHVMASA